MEHVTITETVAAEYVLRCRAHGWERTVATIEHAVNAGNVHLRRQHFGVEPLGPGDVQRPRGAGQDDTPASYDVSAAAAMVVSLVESAGRGSLMGETEVRAAVAVFGCLLDVDPAVPAGYDDVVRAARRLAEDDVTAYPPPL